ncbi:single-stranded DNA-binding protein [Oscillibacter sp.]|uniref:single-stranded DNA-binding protein n=1 Tax=Oscillibacter sp. TaxID=1945593 RepID=UPI001B659214|nr:single-stranded DNA-binding protein [Oscillibacter sp.]MBP3509201.1 single-stranded DNA-binding protein [Oscillibacter sp.]
MNQAIIIGNLTQDPELKYTSGNTAVCKFTVAVRRNFKNQSGEYDSDFLPVTAWRELAELCARYLAKGKKAAVSGSIQTRSYEGSDGKRRYVTELVASQVEFLSPRGQTAQPAQQRAQPNAEGPDFEMYDESLPF